MKKLHIHLAFILAFAGIDSGFAQPSFEWAAQLSGGYDTELIDQVVDDNGFVYSVGTFTGTVDFDPAAGVFNLSSYGPAPTYHDIYITKHSQDNNLVWATKIATDLITYTEAVSDIALDPSGNLLISGYFQGNRDFDPGSGTFTLSTTNNQVAAFVLKLDSNGGFIWALNPNWKTKGVGITTDSNGDIYAALNVNDPQGGDMISFPAGGPTLPSAGNSFFIWKISSTGTTQWVKKASGSFDLPIHCIETNDEDEVLFAGRFGTGFLNLIDFGGPNNINGNGNANGFVAKINSNGSHQWNRVFDGGTSSWFYCRDIEIVDANRFIVGGDFMSTCNFDPPLAAHSHSSAGASDGFLVEMDFNNSILASYTFGGTSFEMVYSVASNQAGHYYLGGRFQGTSDMDPSEAVNAITSAGDYDAFILKLNGSGNFDWAIGYGSTGYEETNTLNILGDALYVGGEFENTIDFDPDGPVVDLSSGAFDKDPFIVKLSECIPSALTPDATVLSDLTDECSVSAPTPPTASNCLGAFNGTPDVAFPITESGTTTITWTYNDGNGNTSTQTQNVIINDVTAPVPDNNTLAEVTGECEITSLTPPTATDNCSGALSGIPDVTFPITASGMTMITWTFDDGNGNTSTQTQNVIINDVTAPVPDNNTLAEVTGECEITSLTPPTATDNCSGTLSGVSDVAFPITESGTTIITWTYDDGNGNTSTQTQNVIINDVTAPVPDNNTLAEVTGECEITSLTPPTATDNCGGSVTVTNDATFPISTQGTTVVTWTYDDGNGNTATQTQNVLITDVTAPVADVANLVDYSDECPIELATIGGTPTATDNCSGTITGTPDVTFPITASGTTTITWTFDDGNGNMSTQTQDVTITPIDNGITQVDAVTFSADASAASYTYQWVDCNNGNAPVNGATGQTFTPPGAGSYACVVDNGFCSITTDCLTSSVGIIENGFGASLIAYPNPTLGRLRIDLGDIHESVSVKVINTLGQAILHESFRSTKEFDLNIEGTPGIYILEVQAEKGKLAKMTIVKK